MIKVDLKKDELSKPARPSAAQVLKRYYAPFAPKVSAILGDARNLVTLLVVAAFSLLPYLFFTQYRAFIISQHRASLSRLSNDSEALGIEIEKLRPFQRELDSYEQQKRIVTERIQVVNRLLNARATPVLVMDAIGQSLPPKAWLTSVTYSLKDKPPTILLQGSAYTHEDISDFVEKILESAYIQEVVLEDVATVGDKGVEQKNFVAKLQPRETTVVETNIPRDTGNVKVVPLAEKK